MEKACILTTAKDVIPAKAGIQLSHIIMKPLDPARSGIFTGETLFHQAK